MATIVRTPDRTRKTKTRFLKVSLELFREHGSAALAHSALWNLEEVRATGKANKNRTWEEIARLAGIPYRTFRKHAEKLIALKLIQSTGKQGFGSAWLSLDLTNAQRLYREGQHRKRGEALYAEIPVAELRSGKRGTLRRLMLLEYLRLMTYDKANGGGTGGTRRITLTLAEIVGTLGGEARQWKNLLNELAKGGEIRLAWDSPEFVVEIGEATPAPAPIKAKREAAPVELARSEPTPLKRYVPPTDEDRGLFDGGWEASAKVPAKAPEPAPEEITDAMVQAYSERFDVSLRQAREELAAEI